MRDLRKSVGAGLVQMLVWAIFLTCRCVKMFLLKLAAWVLFLCCPKKNRKPVVCCGASVWETYECIKCIVLERLWSTCFLLLFFVLLWYRRCWVKEIGKMSFAKFFCLGEWVKTLSALGRGNKEPGSLSLFFPTLDFA